MATSILESDCINLSSPTKCELSTDETLPSGTNNSWGPYDNFRGWLNLISCSVLLTMMWWVMGSERSDRPSVPLTAACYRAHHLPLDCCKDPTAAFLSLLFKWYKKRLSPRVCVGCFSSPLIPVLTDPPQNDCHSVATNWWRLWAGYYSTGWRLLGEGRCIF